MDAGKIEFTTSTLPQKARITWLLKEAPASFLLSFVAGFVDTAGFIALGGLFTAHVTGNLVLAGASIVEGTGGEVLSRLLMIPIFIVTVALTIVFSTYAKRRNIPVTPILLLCQAFALSLFLLVGVILTPQKQFIFDQAATIAIGACGVVAMGLQNTLMREGFNTLLPTTVMTGNLTQLTIDLVHLAQESRHLPPEGVQTLKKRTRHYCYVLVGFVGGAAAGAYGIATIHFWCVALPVLLIVLLAIASIYRERA